MSEVVGTAPENGRDRGSVAPEVRLLVLAARLRPPESAAAEATELLTGLQASINWPYLQDQALRHRVMALLGRSFQHWGLFDNREARVPNRDLYRAFHLYHAERNRALLAEVGELMAALGRHRDDLVLRKGCHLVPLLYRDPGLRPVSDIDVLVRAQAAPDVTRILRERGYQAGNLLPDRSAVVPQPRRVELFWRLHTNNLPTLHRLTPGDPYVEAFSVDLVTSLFLPGSGYQVPVDDLLDRATDIRLPDGRRARGLDPTDLLIDVCAHLYKESTTLRYLHVGKHQRLLQYCDVAELLGQGLVPYDVLLERVERYGVAAPVYFALAHLEELYPGLVPRQALSRLARSIPDPARFLDSYGEVELDQPLLWEDDFLTRTFAERPRLELPPNSSLV